MDFDMKSLEMLETSTGSNTHSNENSQGKNAALPQSLILNEIHKENEELQVKLKLNYRRLLLFETENTKLIEEKNKFFFEMQNYIERNQLLAEKNTELEKDNENLDLQQQLLNEKVYTLEKINATQLTEIKRFSKFHLKIQDVVKPFILQLKSQLAATKQDLTRSQKLSQQMHIALEESQKKFTAVNTQRETEQQIHQIEKRNLITTYEEQIHSFSKEILELQNKDEEKSNEISRLKKAIEFKNYFENELIKFKRIHEEDQIQMNSLTQIKTALEIQVQNQELALANLKMEFSQTKNRLEEKESTLEATRQQLSKQIDESVTMHERLSRLEKLNNQLSREMQPT